VAGGVATTPCCAASSPSAGQPTVGGQLPDTPREAVTPWGSIPPTFARPHPTLPPAAPMTATQPAAAERRSPKEAGLIVSGMGLAAIAGLAAWFGHRRRPEEADAHEERRILPPT
jgi:hypothetical protein